MSNYPPGVTGNEIEIAGPDVETELMTPCPDCAAHNMWYYSYGKREWLWCGDCLREFEVDEFDWEIYRSNELKCTCQACEDTQP